MKNRKTIKYAVWGVCSVVVPLLFIVPMAFGEPYLIADDPVGGDCMLIGTWDAGTKTCLLNANVYAPVEIVGNGITLDGNGYVLLGTGDGYGVTITGVADATVRNLVVDFHAFGITLNQASGVLLEGNTVSRTTWGIWLNDHSLQNVVMDNMIESNDVGMYVTWYSAENVIESNVLTGNATGLSLGYTYHNEIANNAFLDNDVPIASRYFANAIHANYWSNYDTPEEGCFDADANGFCDAPFVFVGGTDDAPGMTEDVDTIPPMVEVWATPAVLLEENKMVDVLVDGAAEDSKSGLASLTITLDDEYDQYDQTIEAFGEIVSLRSHCDEKDLDGRHYVITVVATDMKGNETNVSTTVLVPNPKTAKMLERREK